MCQQQHTKAQRSPNTEWRPHQNSPPSLAQTTLIISPTIWPYQTSSPETRKYANGNLNAVVYTPLCAQTPEIWRCWGRVAFVCAEWRGRKGGRRSTEGCFSYPDPGSDTWLNRIESQDQPGTDLYQPRTYRPVTVHPGEDSIEVRVFDILDAEGPHLRPVAPGIAAAHELKSVPVARVGR